MRRLLKSLYAILRIDAAQNQRGLAWTANYGPLIHPGTKDAAVHFIRASQRHRVVGGWLSGTYTPVHFATAAKRARGMRVLLFSLECGLGTIGLLLGAAWAHWHPWLLPAA